MNTNDIKLPPLPQDKIKPAMDHYGSTLVMTSEVARDYARSAIKPYIKRIAELEAQIEAIGAGGVTEGQRLIEADRKRRGEPVLVGWTVSTTGGGILHASKYTEYEAKRSGYSLPVYRLTSPQPTEPVKGESVAWQPIDTAPTDNKRPLYLARFHEGELVELDFNGRWEYWQESYEMPHINGYAWESNNGIEEPTHWAYQDDPLPTTTPQPVEPVSKTDWNSELSSWSDEDFVRVFHERPDLADRLRKILSEPVVTDASLKVVGKPPVPSNDEIIDTAISSGLASRDSVGDVVCAWREDVDISEYLIDNARALLNRYGQQAQIDDSVFKGNSLVGEWICDADAPTPEEEAEWKRIEDAKEKNTNDKDYSF